VGERGLARSNVGFPIFSASGGLPCTRSSFTRPS
jgi:hypothetical protein